VKPTLRANAGIFDLAWAEEKIAVRIDRLHENSSNSVVGEITVKTLLPGVASHLHQAQLNLTSTSARRTLAKHLEERLPELDWGAIIEQACVLVLRAYREGEPVVELHDAPKREGPRHRVEPLLLDHQPNLFYGDGAVGKSVFALFLGVLVSSGYHVCGLNPTPGKVLYLDYETSGEEMRERVEMIEAGLGEPTCAHIEYRFCVHPLASEIEEIQRLVAEHEIDLVIIDSMGVALGGEKGDPRVPTVEYFRALRSLRCCTLTIDHITKAEGSHATPYGSGYKKYLARNMFEMRKQQDVGDSEFKIGLYHRKINFGALMRPMGYRLTFNENALHVAQTDVRDVPELAEGMSAKDRIKAVLRKGAMLAEDIARETGIGISQVRPRLSELHKAGEVVNVKGQWALAARPTGGYEGE